VSRYTDGPLPLRLSLQKLARRYRKIDLEAIDIIRHRWVETVGPVLAARCTPSAVRDGVLVVSVPSGAFAQRVSRDERMILEHLADLGSSAPRSVRAIVEN